MHASHQRTASLGMLWITVSSSIAKIASLLSQIVLGWVLSTEDFALYAIAISISSLVWSMKNGGLHKVLLQRGAEYANLASNFFRIALIFNLLIMTILLICAPIAAKIYSSPSLPPLIWVIALSVPLTTASMVFRSKLSIDLKFGILAKIESISAILRYGSMVVFALSGFGALSFALPLIVVALFEWFATWRYVRRWPRRAAPLWPLFRDTFRDSRWVIFSALVVTLSMQGDYLLIGLLENKLILGIYFFAFQLTVAFAVLFSGGIDAVMLPSFAKLAAQPLRQSDAFLKATRVLSLITTPLSICAALLIGPAIHAIWAGKWDSSIIVAQLMLLTLITRLPLSLAFAFLEAKGLWRARALIQGSDSIGMIVAAGIGVWFGDLLSIAICSSAYRLVGGLIFCLIAVRVSGTSAIKVFWIITAVAGIASAAGVLSFVAVEILLPIESSIIQSGLRGIIFAGLFATITFIFSREQVRETWALFRTT